MTRNELETQLKRTEQEIDLLTCILTRNTQYGCVPDDRLETIRAALIQADATCRLLKEKLNMEDQVKVAKNVVKDAEKVMTLLDFMQEVQYLIWMKDVRCDCREEPPRGWFAANGEIAMDLAKGPCRYPMVRIILDIANSKVRGVYSYKTSAILADPERTSLRGVLREIERHMAEHSMH